ncbi:hypothetical protein LCGC14_2914910 [marine sediment metagenome]|uniref:Uncharacterized protein n=1 Tax=marine sediment metagenome TaxID=412755 RepID=A0A0F8ZY63_9ZZZZ
MCGGLRFSKTMIKERQLVFRQGMKYTLPTTEGHMELIYDGSLRSENLNSWKPYIKKRILILAEEYLERKTKQYQYDQFRAFKTNGKGIHAAILTDGTRRKNAFRIITMPANSEVSGTHDRMPVLNEKTYF